MTAIIVGGGPAGHAAARGYRAAGGAEPLLLITDDDREPYQRPPLTKEFLRGELEESELRLGALEEVDVVFGEAVRLDPDAKVVELADGRRFVYSGCVLAPGAEPTRVEGTYAVRSARDAIALAEAAVAGASAIVVGTGFIGCEAAASLAMRGCDVTLMGMEAVPQAARLGRAAGEKLAAILTGLGVTLELGESVDDIAGLSADVVVTALGVTPRVELARAAGVRMGASGVATDAAMRTTAPGVFCAGDACEAQHPVAGRPLRVEHWGDALAQGEVAGRRMAGDTDAVWDVVPGFWSTIGTETLKYAAWGDGYTTDQLVEGDDGAWTVWYSDDEGRCVGALCHDADADYERAKERLSST